MASRYVVFPAPGLVEVAEETVPPPGAGEVRCRADVSLISTGTEGACLRGVFDPGTNWADWVRYPFRPGYSMAATVTEVGPGVTGVAVGDRVASWAPHAEEFVWPAHDVYPIPAGVSSQDAAWAVLGSTTQLAVRRASLELGERVGVIGAGLLGQLIVQYCLAAGARTVVSIDAPGPRLIDRGLGRLVVVDPAGDGLRGRRRDGGLGFGEGARLRPGVGLDDRLDRGGGRGLPGLLRPTEGERRELERGAVAIEVLVSHAASVTEGLTWRRRSLGGGSANPRCPDGDRRQQTILCSRARH